MAMKTEADLRNWLRRAADKENAADKLTWIEAAPGGTVGVADCLIAVDADLCAKHKLPGSGEGYLLPCELKVVKEYPKHSYIATAYRADISPAQILWHEKMAKQGIRTIILCLIVRADTERNADYNFTSDEKRHRENMRVGVVPGCRVRQLAHGCALQNVGFRTVAQFLDAILLGTCGYDFAPLLRDAPVETPLERGKRMKKADLETAKAFEALEKPAKKPAKGRKLAMKSAA